MPRTLVICIGNTLRSDDGFAWHVADELSSQATDDLRVLKVLQLTPELAEAISEVELVVFVDAAAHGEPGTLTYDLVTGSDPDLRYSHDFTPATLIQMAKTLFGLQPQAFLICVAGKTFEHGESLSLELSGAISAAVSKIRELAAI
ncbi:MAG TPA: hydrogenase maturation protease [Terriglobales bacterium]|nr:hydrogenase maturation protease [Terriglobales bacterium]